MMKPSEEENKKLLEKVEDYLKSDSYMYAPLIGPQPSHAGGANSASPQSGTLPLFLSAWYSAVIFVHRFSFYVFIVHVFMLVELSSYNIRLS